MELKLTDGKYIRGEKLGVAQVSEVEELLQRIEMKLKIRRGAFLPLPDYGSRLHLLSTEKPSNRQSAARQYVLEALADEMDVEIASLELVSITEAEARLSLSFTYKGEFTVNLDTAI